ncbi:Tim44 domain-containing protein [Hydrogenophaga sp. PAMC20947]|nr:Tim44 domain-containing protein [Hydrogenophaga sp. PAMC20947]
MSGLWAGLLAGVRGAIRPKTADASGNPVVAQGPGGGVRDTAVIAPRGYSPKNVGNDASARPWESVAISSPQPDSAPASGIPADFDVEAFLTTSKTNFVSLQAAWNQADVASLRAMMTEAMLEQIQGQLAERERPSAGAQGTTEVVMLDAHLLGVEDQGEVYLASVEFSGMLREESSAGPNPFREIWVITRPKVGFGDWLVAGVQALQ